MKHARSLALVLAALAASLFPQNVRAEAEVSFEYFDEALSPLGEWIEVEDYGLCWRPTGVAADWAPYTDGYWAYTDAGWTWVSYEDWGGITYHYGRWVHVLDEGWVWVPDYQWGPAWVSWRSSEEYVGWAPLPPEARWEETTGFSTWVDTSYDIGPESYRFCHTRDFGAPVLAPVCLPYEQNVTFIVSTVNVTNITYNHHSSVVFCGGPSFIDINRHCHRPIPSLKLRCEDREVRGPHGNRQPQIVRGNALAVYAPKMKRPVDLQALPVKPQRVVGAEKINRGWSRGTDLAAQQQIKERLQKQTAGLTPRTAPARPVQAADLRSVPVKALPDAPAANVVVRNGNRPGRDGTNGANGTNRAETGRNPVLSQRPVAGADLPRASANPPPVAERVRPQPERPVPPPPVAARPPQVNPQPPRVPQVAVPDENARAAEVERVRVQREQQEAAARRADEVQRGAAARQQQEAAQRANELRNQQAQQNQQQENARRAAVERSQRVPEVRPRQQNEAAGREQEAQRQQLLQQRQQTVARQQQENANRVAAVRQQQEAVQRSSEVRQRQAEQQQSAQRANEMRAQQAQQNEVARQRQEVMHRQNEMRQPQQQQQQTHQAAPPQRPQAAPPAQPPPQSRPAPARGDDDDKNKKHSR